MFVIQENIHEKLCRSIFVTGCSLSMVDHPAWKEVWHSLRPSYNPPSRKVVEDVYLNSEYMRIFGDLTTALSDSDNLHLHCEKSGSFKNENILNLWVSTVKPLFYKFVDLNHEDESQSLYQELLNIVSGYGAEKFLVVVVSDDNDIQSAIEELKKNYDHLVPLNCLISTLKQLFEDILDSESVKNHFDECSLLINAVYKSELINDIFSQLLKINKCKTVLKTPIKNDYESYLQCLENLIKCKASLQQMVLNDQLTTFFKEKVHMKLRMKILDCDHLWTNTEQMINIITPIIDLIKDFSEEAEIYKVRDQYCELEKTLTQALLVSFLTGDEKNNLISNIEEKKKKILKPIHSAACLLDPNSQGLKLTSEELLDGCEFIDTVARNTPDIDARIVMDDLGDYRCKLKVWSRQFIWKSAATMTPLSWWRGLCSHSQLSKVAMKILSAPVTAAVSDKSGNELVWIEKGKDENLSMEKIEKLTFISHNWTVLNEHNFEKVQETLGGENEQVQRIIVDGGNAVQLAGDTGNEEHVEYLEYEYLEETG